VRAKLRAERRLLSGSCTHCEKPVNERDSRCIMTPGTAIVVSIAGKKEMDILVFPACEKNECAGRSSEPVNECETRRG